MLTDGIQLLGTSTAENFTITSGATLPPGAQNTGELFYKTGTGLHVYDGSAWVLVGSGSWGTITGTLSSQIDLSSALAAKADLTSGYVPLTQLASGTAAAGKYLAGDGSWTTLPTGTGTVSSVSVVANQGVSGSVATATSTPAITLTLGNITPTSVATTGASTFGSSLSGSRPILTAAGGYGAQLRLETNSDGQGFDIGRDSNGFLVFQGYQAGYGGFDFKNPAGTTMLKILANSNLVPGADNTQTLGTSGLKWSNVFATTFTGATTAIAGGTAGSLVIQTGVGTTGFVAGGTAGYVLTSTGATTAPTWQVASGGGGGSGAAIDLTGTTLATNVVISSLSSTTANIFTAGSFTGAVATPSYISLGGSYANTATPSNQQSKLYLFKAATDSYSFAVTSDSGIWTHAGDTASAAGTVGYHQWASQGVKRMRLTPLGNLVLTSGGTTITPDNSAGVVIQAGGDATIVRARVINTGGGSTNQADINLGNNSTSQLFTGIFTNGTAADATVTSTSLTTNDAYLFATSSTHRYGIFTNSIRRLTVTVAGDVVIGTGALATSATTGFLNIPGVAGVPTGAATAFTGRAPITIDTTNNSLYFYSNGAWRTPTSATATNITGGAAGSVVYQSAASTTATLPVGTVGKVLTSTGTAPAWTAPIYDLALSVNGKPTNSATVLAFTAVRAFTLPASFTGSVAKAGISATASSVFTVNKNGSSIGSITFAAAASTGTYSGAGGTFAVSDILTIIAPASPDATLADIGMTIVAQLT